MCVSKADYVRVNYNISGWVGWDGMLYEVVKNKNLYGFEFVIKLVPVSGLKFSQKRER